MSDPPVKWMLLSLPAHLLFHSLLQVLIRGPQEGEFVSPPKVIHLLRHYDYQTILEPEMKTEILVL